MCSKLFLYFQLKIIMEELWFVDTPVWTETTISQFLDIIEGNETWNDVDKKTFTLNHLKGAADLFAKEHLQIDMDWDTIKLKLFEQFKCQVNVWDKVEMKRNLVQGENETLRVFYNRCVSYQYILSDDYGELVMDNDIMINFLHGMNRQIFNILSERLSISENIVDLNLCVSEAEVIEAEFASGEQIIAPVEGHEQEGYYDYSQNSDLQTVAIADSTAPCPSINTYQSPPKKIQNTIVKSENPAFQMNNKSPAIVDTFSLPKVKKENPTIKRENQNYGMMATSMNSAGPSYNSEYESPSKKARNTSAPEGFTKTPDGKIICMAPNCGKEFTRLDNAKVHAIKKHSPDQAIECPLCKYYCAKNSYDFNEHARKVHQMSAHDMKNLQILYSSINPSDPILAKRPDGKVACLKCLDEQGCHKTFTRMDNAKVHFNKIHGQTHGRT